MTVLVVLDTNAYLRLAKRIQPFLGKDFGQKRYKLTVLKLVEDEVRRQPRLKSRYPWFTEVPYKNERLAKQVNLSKTERVRVDLTTNSLMQYVAQHVGDFTSGGRSPPSREDCYCLAFGQVRPAIVVTDDIGMHELAKVFEFPIWHGCELLKKMLTAKMIDKDKVREIYAALETNGDMTKTWEEAKVTAFKKVFR
jgi:hypothetical protein